MKRLALAGLLAACHHGPAPRSHAADAIVYVHSNVSDAQIFVDGRLVGPLAAVRAGIAVDPGRHRLELRRDDYFSRYVELDLQSSERKKLELEMAPVLP